MAKKKEARSLDLLARSAALVMRLGEMVGKDQGRVGVLRDRLRRAQSSLDAHRKSHPLDRREAERRADRVFFALAEYLVALIAESRG